MRKFKVKYHEDPEQRMLDEVGPEKPIRTTEGNRAAATDNYGIALSAWEKQTASLQSLLCPSMKKEMDGKELREDEIELDKECLVFGMWKKAKGGLYEQHCKARIIATIKQQEKRIGTDNICPITKALCNDECCPPGAICNLSNAELFKQGEKTGENEEFIQKHLGIIKEKMRGNFIHQHIAKMWGGLEMASIQNFIETGRISGSFRNNLLALINDAMQWQVNLKPTTPPAPAPAESGEEVSVEKINRAVRFLAVELHPDVYDHFYKLWKSFLASHSSKGQEAVAMLNAFQIATEGQHLNPEYWYKNVYLKTERI